MGKVFFPASYVRLPEGKFHQKKPFSFDQQLNWVVQPPPFELRLILVVQNMV